MGSDGSLLDADQPQTIDANNGLGGDDKNDKAQQHEDTSMDTGSDAGPGDEIDSRIDVDIDGETREVDNNSNKMAPETPQQVNWLKALEQQNRLGILAARNQSYGGSAEVTEL